MEKKYLAFNTEFKADGEEGVIEGYAAYFNNVDSYNDVILQGAFKNITDVSDVKLFYNHEWNTVPIGTVMQLYEDDKGLKFQAKFNQTTLADDVKEAIKTGGITKMSIGYSVKDSEFNRDTGIRYIKDINLYEISPVNFPANDMAAIQSYKKEGENVNEIKKIDAKLNKLEAFMKNNGQSMEFKNLDTSQTINNQLREKLLTGKSDAERIAINHVFPQEIVFNHWMWGANDDLLFDKYYRQGYSVNGNTVDLVGEATEVTFQRAIIDRKSKEDETFNKETKTDAEQLMAALNNLK